MNAFGVPNRAAAGRKEQASSRPAKKEDDAPWVTAKEAGYLAARFLPFACVIAVGVFMTKPRPTLAGVTKKLLNPL